MHVVGSILMINTFGCTSHCIVIEQTYETSNSQLAFKIEKI